MQPQPVIRDTVWIVCWSFIRTTSWTSCRSRTTGDAPSPRRCVDASPAVWSARRLRLCWTLMALFQWSALYAPNRNQKIRTVTPTSMKPWSVCWRTNSRSWSTSTVLWSPSSALIKPSWTNLRLSSTTTCYTPTSKYSTTSPGTWCKTIQSWTNDVVIFYHVRIAMPIWWILVLEEVILVKLISIQFNNINFNIR